MIHLLYTNLDTILKLAQIAFYILSAVSLVKIIIKN